MCSYKYVRAAFDVWGLSGRVESYVHSVSKILISYMYMLMIGYLFREPKLDNTFRDKF